MIIIRLKVAVAKTKPKKRKVDLHFSSELGDLVDFPLVLTSHYLCFTRKLFTVIGLF